MLAILPKFSWHVLPSSRFPLLAMASRVIRSYRLDGGQGLSLIAQGRDALTAAAAPLGLSAGPQGRKPVGTVRTAEGSRFGPTAVSAVGRTFFCGAMKFGETLPRPGCRYIWSSCEGHRRCARSLSCPEGTRHVEKSEGIDWRFSVEQRPHGLSSFRSPSARIILRYRAARVAHHAS